MLFQASAAKSEFVCATQMPTKSPKAVAAVKPCADILQLAADMPEVSEVDVDGIGVPTDQNAQEN